MSRNKNKNKKKQQKDPSKRVLRLDLDPDVMKGVWGICSIVGALLLILSFIGMGGSAGGFVVWALEWLLGLGKYLVPLVLIVSAVVFFTSWRRSVYGSTILGMLLFFSSALGMLALSDAENHMRGGMWGWAISWPILQMLGAWGAALVFIAAFFASLLIGLNIPLGKFFSREAKEELRAKQAPDHILSGKEAAKVAEAEQEEKAGIRSSAQASPEESKKTRQGSGQSGRDDEKHFEVKAGRLPGISGFRLPPLDLLDPETDKPSSGDIVARANIIKRTLANFGTEVEMGEVNVGPTVTQFTLKPAEGIKLARITALHNDLALALAAHPLRIEAPIPGRALVGIEVPNKGIATVRARNILEYDGFKKAASSLTLGLGRDVTGAPVYANLGKMPHLLIAGSTGSGKTIALNMLIVSLLYQNPPEFLRLILIDPKRVEFPVYADIPHLLAPVVVDNQKAVNALRWTVSEMERRFEVLARAHARDIQGYNTTKKVVEEDGPLPYIVVVIDELADLMTSRGKEAEALIVRLAQMSRAVGIHLVLATQRPSVEVITGLIKANITARMAFQVASQIDSRTVLDMAGAEKLLGSGDMLYLAPENSKPKRVQGAFISDKEVKRVTDFLREESQRAGATVQKEEMDLGAKPMQAGSGSHVDFDAPESEEWDGDDPLYEDARRVVVESKRASASLLQRRLRVGYARAARLVDMLEERGVVGPGEGAKPREVYETMES